jgi:hypothetical protein
MHGFKTWFVAEARLDQQLRPVDPKNRPKDVPSLMKHLRVSRYDDPPYKQLLDFVGKNGNLQTFEKIIEDNVKQLRIWTSFDPCKMAGDENPMRAGEGMSATGQYQGGETTGVSGAEMNQRGRARIFSADNLPAESQMKYAAIYGPGDIPKNSYYGPFSIEWNAEALKDRMTVTADDSLETDADALHPTDIENVIVSMLRIGMYHKVINQAATQAGVNINDPQYKQILNSAKKMNFNGYMEVQIWGELPLTKDTVKGLYIFGTIWDNECEASAVSLINSFKAKGIPVHFEAENRFNDTNFNPRQDTYKNALAAITKHLKPGLEISYKDKKGNFRNGIIQAYNYIGPRYHVRIRDRYGKEDLLSADPSPREADFDRISADAQGNVLVNGQPATVNAPKSNKQLSDGDQMYLKIEDKTNHGYVYNIDLSGYGKEPMFSYSKLTSQQLADKSILQQLQNTAQILPIEHKHMTWSEILQAWNAGIQKGWSRD